MRGDRFKRRVPKFVGRISDIADTFVAEDKEFYKIDALLEDFLYGLIVSTLDKTSNPYEFLKRFEKDYGLESVGNLDDRIKALLVKIGSKKTTTEEVILDICEMFGYPAIYHEKYREYAFLVDLFVGEGGGDLDQLQKAIREVSPAHLEDRVNINIARDLVLESRAGDSGYLIYLCGEHPCGDIPYPSIVGKGADIDFNIETGAYDSHNYYGYTSDNYRSGELRDKGIEGYVYVQNTDVNNEYDFGGDVVDDK